MTRRRFTQWIVLDTDRDGGDSSTLQFDTFKRGAIVIDILRRRHPERCYSDPTRVTVLLPGATK